MTLACLVSFATPPTSRPTESVESMVSAQLPRNPGSEPRSRMPPQQRRRGQRRQRHEAVDDVHGQLDAQHEHRADRRHAEALEDLQLPQAGYGLRLSMARKRLSRPLTGAACFAIFRDESIGDDALIFLCGTISVAATDIV